MLDEMKNLQKVGDKLSSPPSMLTKGKWVMRKVNQDPFGSGLDHIRWSGRNCEVCWKQSSPTTPIDKVRCSIERDILVRMMSDKPIKAKTIEICSRPDCPYRKEKRPKYRKRKLQQEESLF